MKYFVFFLLTALFATASSGGTAMAQAGPPNLSGNWTVQQTGANGTSVSKIVLQQSGMGVTGTNASNGNGFTGTFVAASKMNGTWHGPSGAGWLTVYASPNGHSFNGTWGYNGRPANGSYVGNKYLPPSAITAAGTWKVAVAGGGAGFTGPMVCTQAGPSALCHSGTIIINGKFRTPDKMRALWTNGSKHGWFSYWFNADGNSFNGEWGRGADTTPAVGRVIGQRSLG
jgi:hypothetical protein